jgi:hypothetical protein
MKGILGRVMGASMKTNVGYDVMSLKIFRPHGGGTA